MNLVSVRWVDHVAHENGWAPVEEYRAACAEESFECETAGWLVFGDDRSIGLAQSRYTDESSVMTVQQILRSCIVSTTVLVGGAK